MKKFKNVLWIIALILVIALIGGILYGYYKNKNVKIQNPIATMEIENYGTIKIELYPELAKDTVANFTALANRGFYNGLTFHRVIKDFMIQGGDKEGTGTGSAKISDLKDGGEEKPYTIKGEFIANGVDNKLKFEEGVLGMARSDYMAYSPSLDTESYNSGSSQFFIMTKYNPSLNGHYTSFGKVIEGMDVVHKIENVEVKAPDNAEVSQNIEKSIPVTPIKITKVSVDTFGQDLGLPKTLEPFDMTSWMYQQYGIDPNTMITQE